MSITLPDAPAPPAAATQPTWPAVPYRGLDFFREQDAPLFVERERDAEICGARLTHSTTRLLLLQGTTGAGKTSFLRAALCPWLADTDEFWVLRDAQGLPEVLRCTDAPLERLRTVLLTAAEAQDGPLQKLLRRRNNALDVAAAALRAPMPDPAALAEGVEQALREITAVLPRTLVLVLDQAEEVFTLRPGPEGDAHRRSFFRMLRQFCRFGAGLRVVLSLRTEFFGQFCDAFGSLPVSEVSTVLSGYQQYRLQGLATEDQLVAAIRRPTEDAEIPGFEALGKPRDHYHFTYDEGVAEKIAADVRRYSERVRVGTLPVLQVVCLELWTHLRKTAGDRAPDAILRVTMDEYRALGDVAKAIERHIGVGIANALQDCSAPSYADLVRRWWATLRTRFHGTEAGPFKADMGAKVECWQYALSKLAAEQDGGATASLVLAEQDLLQAAEESGLRRPQARMLAALAREPTPLLRRIGQGDLPRYSLRHDVVAVCLSKLRPHLEARMRQRQWRRWYLACTLALALVAAMAVPGYFGSIYGGRKQQVDRITAFARSDASGGYRLRLLLLLKAFDAAGLRDEAARAGFWTRKVDGFVRLVMWQGDSKIREALAEVLLQSPLPEPDLRAAGVGEQGGDLVRYMEQGDQAWLEIRGADGRSTQGCQVSHTRAVGYVVPTAGFVGSGAGAAPAVVDILDPTGTSPNIRIQLCQSGMPQTFFAPKGFLPRFREPNAPPIRLDIANGRVRVTQFTMRSGGGVEKLKLAELGIVDSEGSPAIRIWDPVNVTWMDTNMAVVGPCDRYGSVEQVPSSAAGKPVVLGSLLADQTADRLPFDVSQGTPGLSPVPEGMAFTTDCRWFAARRAQQERDEPSLRVFDLSSLADPGGPRFHDVALPTELQRVARPRWLGFRPPHALEAKGGTFRMAWYVPEVMARAPQLPAPAEGTGSQGGGAPLRPGLAVVSWPAPRPGAEAPMQAGPMQAGPLEGTPILAAGAGNQGFPLRLFFAGHGDLLVAEDLYFGQDPPSRVRLWDLRFTERRKELLGEPAAGRPAPGLPELRRIACDVAATDPEGNQLNLPERLAWFGDKDTPQPCR